MLRAARCVLLVIGSLSASSCTLLSGKCLYETRNVLASGSIATSSTDSASAIVTETEQRDYQPSKDFSWQISGPDLKGHVQQIVFLETATASTPRFVFDIHQSSTIPLLSSGYFREGEVAGLNFSGLYDLLWSREAVIRITTDLPARPTVVIPLTRVQGSDWTRPYCS
jgi:hypothetical protein